MAKPGDKTEDPTGNGTGQDDTPLAWYERPGREADLMRRFRSFDEMRAFLANVQDQVIRDLTERLRRATEAEARPQEQPRNDEPPDGLGQRGGSEYSEPNANDGLGTVFRHIVKPISGFVDPATRDDPVRIERSKRHLDKITNEFVSEALNSENVLIRQHSDMMDMRREMNILRNQMTNMRHEARMGHRTISDKSGRIHPNPADSYPDDDNPCANHEWHNALKEMNGKIKNIERSVTFISDPYTFLLEICVSSNIISSQFGLTVAKQKTLIEGFIPPTSVLHKELRLLGTLDQIFDLASNNSTAILTKSEIDQKIDRWHLDLRSIDAMTQSLVELKTLYADSEGKAYNTINQQLLYANIIRRVKREPNLSNYIIRKLEECQLQIKSETDIIELHNLLVQPLKELVTNRERNKTKTSSDNRQSKQGHVFQVHQLEAAPPPLALTYESANRGGGAGNDRVGTKNKPQNKSDQRGRQKTKGGGQGNNRNKGGRQRSQSSNKFFTIPPWPPGKKYLGANGKNLSKEFEEAFKNACYRCGHTSHKAQDCRIYPNSTIMSLCTTCRNGLHDMCKSYKFKNKEPQDSAVATVKKFENMLGKFEQFAAHTIQSGPNHGPGLWYPPYPYPPPPALPQPQQRVGFTDEDNEDE